MVAWGALAANLAWQVVQGQPAPPEPRVAYPHPLITEILYAVPAGAVGDANRDGVRSATGDEFVEFVNPHDRPIQLKGYSIEDRGRGASQWRFVFPSLELAPGEIIVVFNGYLATWSGPVGDSDLAPAGKHDDFHGAWVFTSRAKSPQMALANTADHVLLRDPAGQAVHLIVWGIEGEGERPDAAVVDEAPVVVGRSIHRRSVSGVMEAHPKARGVPLSPGVFPATEDPDE